MDNQSITLPPKPNPKGKAITSLIFGIISVLPLIVILIFSLLPWIAKDFYWETYNILPLIIALGVMMFFPVAFLSGIIGLILGKLGLKSTQKKLAIIGIILSLLGLGGSIFYLLMFLLVR